MQQENMSTADRGTLNDAAAVYIYRQSRIHQTIGLFVVRGRVWDGPAAEGHGKGGGCCAFGRPHRGALPQALAWACRLPAGTALGPAVGPVAYACALRGGRGWAVGGPGVVSGARRPSVLLLKPRLRNQTAYWICAHF